MAVQNFSQPQDNKRKKRIIFAAIILVLCFVIALGIALTVILSQKGNKTAESDESDIYSIDEDNLDVYTGGEDEALPEDQDINFLTKYGVTEDDAFYVEEKIFEVADEYYEEDGYNAIYYNTNDVKVSDNGNKIFFTAYTDWADRNIEVTVYLVNGEVDTVEIY